MNNWTISGNLGRDPELRSTKGGDSVCNFSVAVKRWKKDDDALWVDVSVWGKQGENCSRFLSKGSPVVVAGEADYRTYDKRDGGTGVSITLNARQVTFVGGGSSDGGSNGFAPAPDTSDFAPAPAEDDDIPF